MLSPSLLSFSLLSSVFISSSSALAISNPHLPRAAPAVPLKIQALGDSITFGTASTNGNGYREPLLNTIKPWSSFSDITYIGSVKQGSMANNENEGHPGAVISEIGTNATKSLGQQPNLILLMAGTNDINHDTADGAPQRLGELIDQLTTAVPNAVVIVAKLTPIQDAAMDEKRVEFNSMVDEIVLPRMTSGRKVLSVDMGAALGVTDLQDGLHPNDGGYVKMANTWADGIQVAARSQWFV